ncbi:MAG: ribonuclease J [Clostridia bacterium]|nr:ribonuclease J [Clostridia bacterium]
MFLGGVGEIGKNMMALEYGNDIIIIDCGATFPYSEAMPGIDLVVPDVTYLIQNKNKIRAMLITHGHEDHIGGIPYVVGDLNVPIYGSKLAVALMQNKLKEFPKVHAKFVTVKPRDIVHLGAFTVEFINVCHSIAGSFAMAITTPVGTMVHTGDFKVDFTPLNNNFTDLTRFAELGKKGVLLLTSESTNVEREGYSLSEQKVGKTLDSLFEKYKDDRIFVATFASNVYRLQELLDLAQKYGRKVTFTGRSMQNVTETSYKIGELKFDRNLFIDIDKVNYYKDSELLIITTGSQGEPMSALTRMASGDFQKIKLGEHDCIIFSSSPIPGNEKSVNNVINNLYKLGCTIIYDQLAEVHASGHAYREELKLIHNLINPKFFMPVHGEYRHQKLHKDLAIAMGEQERNILLPTIGDVIEVTARGIRKIGIIPSGNRLVDGLGYGELESVVLRDRKQLSEDGIAVVIMGMNKLGDITSGPEIISRGLVYNGEDTLVKEAKQYILDMIAQTPEKQPDFNVLKNDIRRSLANFFFRKTKRRPMVLAFIFES